MTERDKRVTDDVMIRFDHVRKVYPNTDRAVIDDLSLDIRTGELVVFVGPSGCGKTTTMRMINRMIQPTAGRIRLDGHDISDSDPVELRRRTGYVIQQVGLLPHLNVRANVGLVPRAMGWKREAISERVDELLALVGLEPAQYRTRYPKQLSGGEQQRVGVARALAADPPVLLMDEPFGAIDPVVRDRLQDQLLDLQREIRKTIVFVTHDIQEAVKMGDRIAIFSREGVVAQYDTPVKILSEPANDFVRSFIGTGAAVRLLRLEQIGDARLERVEADLRADYEAGAAAVVYSDQSLHDALNAMLTHREEIAVVVDRQHAVLGALSWRSVLQRSGPACSSRRGAAEESG